jgi:hypothetical protein
MQLPSINFLCHSYFVIGSQSALRFDQGNHVFVEEHLLDRYEAQGVPAEWRRFDSSREIAETWKRLETGTHGPADLELLKHETAEAWYMRNVSPSFNASHEAAERHFSTPIR